MCKCRIQVIRWMSQMLHRESSIDNWFNNWVSVGSDADWWQQATNWSMKLNLRQLWQCGTLVSHEEDILYILKYSPISMINKSTIFTWMTTICNLYNCHSKPIHIVCSFQLSRHIMDKSSHYSNHRGHYHKHRRRGNYQVCN